MEQLVEHAADWGQVIAHKPLLSTGIARQAGDFGIPDLEVLEKRGNRGGRLR